MSAGWSRRVVCPLCGEAGARPWARARGWRVVRCAGCGLRITWPRPAAATRDAGYTEAYHADRGMGPESAAAWRSRARELLALIPGPVERLLDYGAGQGHALAAIRGAGLQGEGVEASPSARDAARRLHGLTLFGELAEVPGADFDAALLIHSLEHLEDPLAALRSVATRVRPLGFVLIEVPHSASVEMWRPLRRASLLDLPHHLYHFTPETLTALVRRAGLEVVAVHLSNPDLLEWLLARRARWRRAADPVASPAPAAAPVERPGPAAGPSPSGLWRRAILPRLRAAFPGWKFQLLARRPERGGAAS